MKTALYGQEAIKAWAKKQSKVRVIGVALATILFVVLLYWYNAQP